MTLNQITHIESLKIYDKREFMSKASLPQFYVVLIV